VRAPNFYPDTRTSGSVGGRGQATAPPIPTDSHGLRELGAYLDLVGTLGTLPGLPLVDDPYSSSSGGGREIARQTGLSAATGSV
jgi:hypothetical protein